MHDHDRSELEALEEIRADLRTPSEDRRLDELRNIARQEAAVADEVADEPAAVEPDPGHADAIRRQNAEAALETLERAELERRYLAILDRENIDKAIAPSAMSSNELIDYITRHGLSPDEVENLPADEDVTEPTERPTSDDPRRAILELNGYAAIREQALGLCNTANALPDDALEAAIVFAERTAVRMRASTDPRAGDAVQRADAEVRYMRLLRTFKRELGKTAAAIEARERLAVR